MVHLEQWYSTFHYFCHDSINNRLQRTILIMMQQSNGRLIHIFIKLIYRVIFLYNIKFNEFITKVYSGFDLL